MVFLGAHLPLLLLSDVHFGYSSAFNDFGPKFTCVDPTGEQPLSGIIASVDKVDYVLWSCCILADFSFRIVG